MTSQIETNRLAITRSYISAGGYLSHDTGIHLAGFQQAPKQLKVFW